MAIERAPGYTTIQEDADYSIERRLFSPEYALMCQGQGTQLVGMGKDLYKKYDSVRHLYKSAHDVLGYDLAQLSFDGPADVLDDTQYAQPAIFTATIAAHRALEEKYGEQFQRHVPAYVMGHSMGEFSALVAAESIDFETGLHLIRRRGEVMKEAGEQNPGGMCVVMGLEVDEVEKSLEDIDGVYLTNVNSNNQVVIGGFENSLKQALDNLSKKKPKRMVRLPISIASHTPLMESAERAMKEEVEKVNFQAPKTEIILNLTGKATKSPEVIKQSIVQSMTRPVQWVKSLHEAGNKGVEEFVEVGPGGNVLLGFVRSERPLQKRTHVNDLLSP